ncbi:YeeE/YedE family protein [Actinobacillus genomosp. 2]|uniref:YeeE/YedE family protein n=1 Tax=Actinobacillus genomosp. 2 TaxID=230709 RepID=UPI002442D8EC|nr:YeeE/YedE family protein [Actinobacillus genomosp. 2]WGE32040.1 YeeE/YedE family protein [Actinobacillus genomosp. 2]
MLISGLFVGLLLGIILQRGQFCLSGQLRQVAFKRDFASFSPLLTAISVQSIGFYLLEQQGVIRFPSSPMPILATLLGAFLFGIGMGVANRCVSGQLYRAGEGMIAAMITLFVFAVTTVATQTGVLKFWVASQLETESQLITLPQTLGISSLWFIIPLSLIAGWGLQKSRKIQPLIPRKPFSQFWSPHFTAILLGLVSILAWAFSAETGREFGLSFSISVGHALQYLTLGQQRYLNWGTYLIIGLVLGSFLSAKLSGNFRWKALSPTDFGKSIAGGILMGIGAALTGGCTMANAVVGTAYFSWQGWIATIVMMFGVWCVFILRKNPLKSTC